MRRVRRAGRVPRWPGPAGAHAEAGGVSRMTSSATRRYRIGNAVVYLIVSMAKRLVTSVSPGVSVSRL